MFIKPFKDFIAEGTVKDKKPDHIEDIKKKEDGSNKELEKEVEEYLDDVHEECVRCGEHIEDCECAEKDPWSTQVYHRTPKGEVEKSEPKQNFKKE